MIKSDSPTVALPLKIPFFTTSLLQDVICVVIFIPFFWLLGFDQLGWPLLAMLFLAKLFLLMAKSGKRLFPSLPVVNATFVFFLLYFCSGFFVQDKVRAITFARNFSMYSSGMVIFLLVIAAVRTKEDLIKAFWALTIFSFITVFVGFLTVVNILDYDFYAPLYHVLPAGIKKFGYVKALLHKTPSMVLNHPDLYLFRLKVFFSFPNQLAALICLTLPIQFILWGTAKKKLIKYFLLLTTILSIINLSYTVSQAGIMGLLVGLSYWMVRKKGFWLKKMLFIFLTSLVILLLNHTFTLVPVVVMQHRIEVKTKYGEPRELIFRETLKSFLELPLLGHGTQVDIPGRSNTAPMGSHSTYLGILYKQGILGLMAFLAIVFNLFLMLERLIKQKSDPFLKKTAEFLSISLVALLVQASVIEIDGDAILLQLVWLFWGLITASYLCYKKGMRMINVIPA